MNKNKFHRRVHAHTATPISGLSWNCRHSRNHLCLCAKHKTPTNQTIWNKRNEMKTHISRSHSNVRQSDFRCFDFPAKEQTQRASVCVCVWHKRIETSASGKSLPINWIKTARVDLSFVFRLMSVSVEWLALVKSALVDHAHYQNYRRINLQMCPLQPIDQLINILFT